MVENLLKRPIGGESGEHLPVRVSRINFLIHPGYLTDPDKVDLQAMDSFTRVKYRLLLGKYVEKAKGMRNDELLFVFTHATAEVLEEDINENKDYARTLLEMQKILGSRMLVIPHDIDVTYSPRAINPVLEEAKRRGFKITKDVETNAFGETLGSCVPYITDNLNSRAGFTKKTIILPELTDIAINDPEIWQRSLNPLSNKFSRQTRVTFNPLKN